jgi:hypothetical protein
VQFVLADENAPHVARLILVHCRRISAGVAVVGRSRGFRPRLQRPDDR